MQEFKNTNVHINRESILAHFEKISNIFQCSIDIIGISQSFLKPQRSISQTWVDSFVFHDMPVLAGRQAV